MDNSEVSNNYFICQTCSGIGKQKYGLDCQACQGSGVVLSACDKFFYWQPKLGVAMISLSSLKRKLHLILNLSALLIGLAGLAALGFWIYEYEGKFTQSILVVFLQSKHWLLSFFWLSVLADMFVVYRASEDKSLKAKIIKLNYEEKKEFNRCPVIYDPADRKNSKNKIDVASGYSYKAMRTVENAYFLARKLKSYEVNLKHLFYSLLSDGEVRAVFSRLGVSEVDLLDRLKGQLLDPGKVADSLELAADLKKVLIEGYLNALAQGQKRVKPINLILPAIANDKVLEEILFDLEIDFDKINNTVAWFRINERQYENYKKFKSMARFKPGTTMDKAYTAVSTPILNSISHDLTLAAKWMKLEFCVGREKEIENIFNAFESGRSGVLLVGEVGVGKSAVIHGLAELMVQEEVPQFLKDKRLVELDASRLISGANPSEAQERLLNVIDEINRSGNIVLYINNIETLVGISAGGEESLDLSDVLVNALERHGLHCLASVSNQNYLHFIENSPLNNVMLKVEIAEPTINQAILILESKVGYLESVYKVYFTYGAIEEVVRLSSKYIHDKYLPTKAIEIMESLVVKISKEHGDKIVTKERVAEMVSDVTGIPITKVGVEEGKDLLDLEKKIHEHMINQTEAVDMVAASLRRARAQLSEGKRPIASFLFLGPTGVGKTELAKTVAKVYFGAENYMIRLDMSEYQNQDSINKMIGDSEGGKGYLTEAVRRAPFSLLLLDEFEKAHPEILNLFLQVMDDGRLTDGEGRTIDFTNCIIIATSNAGALFIQEQVKLGNEMADIKEVLINEHLNKVMKPELINRFDGVIVFKPLTESDVVEIARLMLNKTARNLKEKGIGLRFEENGLKILAELGFDPKFGARPLRRLLQDKVDNIIANKLLAGELKRRDTVVIDENGEVQVEQGREL
ncbi:MAG: ATPase AAA-2 domain protein [Candidatus Falkowbacteria bacterium GW2011_GWF2_39_8]|uniref:ATPase AAA-2 domain protein n=1 Tax=Candidatus Falkowbacteria bacterium GW2011_GWF2_39_8 TaxID=1618642 RepID=A0A0G0Q085_9BACT|nr:MAG: ATPase AAA-2 domain protein [Candidatus Falkowbacteria bacterium GW2011_GWF2_39_8]